jgi:hypothetical protein
VHDLPIAEFRERLRAEGQIIDALPFTEAWPQ